MLGTRLVWTGAALVALNACDQLPDFDLRDLGDGFDTSAAVEDLPNRPRPDDRGVISYPNYQVVVARRDDTIRSIAGRLNLNATELARFNGIQIDAPLRRDELVALPTRVAEPSPATGSPTTGPIQPLDITQVATTALDRAGPQQPVTSSTLPAAPAANQGTEPLRHKVERGQTVFQISRLYNVPVANIAQWNGLGPDLLVREGQFLLIPQAGAQPPATQVAQPVLTAPVAEDTDDAPVLTAPPPATPAPVVAPTPAPSPAPAPAPAPAATSSRLAYPVQGPVIRDYAPGRNDGIDFGVPGGTNVKAADGGTVAAVTTDTNGIAIVVIKHPDNLLTVYTNIENLTVSKNDRVAKGDNIGQVRSSDPSFLHFEVRRGLQSVDPKELLP